MKLVILLATMLGIAHGNCPNSCSGHGFCNSLDQCTCFKEQNNKGYFNADFEWTGADCSLRTCARGVSWTSIGSSTCAHTLEAECSDHGKCDRATGLCTCFAGFEGSSCQRTSCPNDCSGHGTCRSNQDFAFDFSIAKAKEMGANDGEYLETYLTSYESAWDSGLIYGCKCDMGYRGPDCSLVECPSRQDPLDAKCPFGATSNKIPSGAGTRKPNQNEITDFQIQYTVAMGNTGWSSAFAANSLNDKVVASKLYSCYGSMAGQDCSGRGLCDYRTGACRCFNGYSGTACEVIAELA